jgi:transcriptional regulator with XRE-family HTH domain
MKLSKEKLDELRDLPLSYRLVQLRTLHGYTQAEVSQKINVGSSVISLWERAMVIPSAASLGKLSVLYDLPAAFFIDVYEKRDEHRRKE